MNDELKSDIETRSIVIRRSPIILVARLILLEVLLELVYLSLRILATFIPVQSPLRYALDVFFLPAFVLITLFQVVFLIVIVLRWLNNYYELREGELVYVSGVISKKETAYAYANIQSTSMHQSAIGRYFHYGDVTIYIPTIGHDIVMNEISQPAKFVRLIKELSSQPGMGQFVLRGRRR